MHTLSPVDDRPADAEIRAALARVTHSPAFEGSSKLVAFLQFVVERVLAGDAAHIKGYTIATEALDRPQSFDPQTDPIVRVEAGRLRRALTRYYAADGSHDEIVIELPRGHYVPTFRRRSFPLGLRKLPFSARRAIFHRALRRWRLAAVAGACLAVTGIVGDVTLLVWWYAISGDVTGSVDAVAHPRRTARVHGAFPVVYVEPIDVVGNPRPAPIVARHLRNTLGDALARFDEITVVTDPMAGGYGDNTAQPDAARIDYRVSGLIGYNEDGTLTPGFRLIDAADATVVWAARFARLHATADVSALETAIVQRPVMTLAQQNGVIQARERVRRAAGAEIDARYSCLLDANEYRRTYSPPLHATVKACLLRAIADDPAFAAGYSALAHIYLRQYFYGLGGDEREPDPLNRALYLALRAIEIDPESSLAYLTLMSVQFSRHDFAAAMEAGDRAVALNPYDMHILADYGFFQLRLGEVEKGAALLRQALAGGHAPTPRTNYALFVAAYLGGDLTTARRYADVIATDAFPFGLTARALVAAKLGDSERARAALRHLAIVQPSWQRDPRRQLAKVFPDGRIVDRMVADLAAIGLQAQSEAAVSPVH